MSPAQRVGIGVETYIVTTNTMTRASQMGRASLGDLETFETFRAPAELYLKSAVEDIMDGDGDDTQAQSIMELIRPLLDQMIEAQLEAENND